MEATMADPADDHVTSGSDSVITVALLDDHPIVRAGLRSLLEASERVTVVGEASTISEALDLITRTRPDVALVDLNLGQGGSGHDAIDAIARSSPHTRTIVVTAFDNQSDIRAALDAGASGYMLKDAPPEQLVDAVLAVVAGRRPLDPRVSDRLVFGAVGDVDTLTPRELEVVAAVAEGSDNATIARTLFISQATVKSHLTRVFTKLDVTTRTGAVAEARRRGLIR